MTPDRSMARSLGALAAGCAMFMTGCSLPPRGDLPVTKTLGPAELADSRLARATEAGRDAHPGLNAILPLTTGLEAFAARIALIRAADCSLDLQYYIWHDDLTGRLVLGELIAAADRGVRVRILVDDNGIAGMDPALAALDTHPKIDVRIFNPFPTRRAKWVGYLVDFSRLNRRMHNKSLTADAIATIVGGRNIGNEYFDADDSTTFADLDVVAIGPIAEAVATQFDRYWNSDLVWSAASILAKPAPDALERLRETTAAQHKAPDARAYEDSIHHSLTVPQLAERTARIDWVPGRLVSDDPDKAKGKADHDSLLMNQLGKTLDMPTKQFDLISPYFVPTRTGTDALVGLVRRGIKVRVLTNSLQANDVAVVHAGYSKWRHDLLDGGVELYELRPLGNEPKGGFEKAGVGGSSRASLHAKTFAVDGRQVFVGSFNFDPRSAALNTELGVVLDDPTLAKAMEKNIAAELPRLAWQVTLDPEGRLQWTGQNARGEPDIRHHEPDTTPFQRGLLRVISILPIDWLL